MVYYLFFIKNDNIVLRTILKFGGEYMFEFSTNFKKINGDRLTLSLIEEKLPTDFESLPYYYFDIILNSSNEVIGNLTVRIGDNLSSTYEGHIDVDIFDDYRGNRYGYEAITMVLPLYRHYEMKKIILACGENNFASRRVIELLGGQLIEIADAPSEVKLKNSKISSYAIYSLTIPPVDYVNTKRDEHSSMAIVFCKDKVLCLVNHDNRVELPKGHLEPGETSLQAAIRECLEETGVMLLEDDWIKQIKSVEYSFSGKDFRNMTNLQFFATFGVCTIHKKVDIHVFSVDDELETSLTEPKYFKEVKWEKVDQFILENPYEDTLRAVTEALLAL